MSKGLDIGTSYIISATETPNTAVKGITYTEIRDAFFRMRSNSPVMAAMMEKGLTGQKYFKDSDGSYIVVGDDAIQRAVERHAAVSRPMSKGVISPKEKDARRILKFILGEVLGPKQQDNEVVVFSIPAKPVDCPEEEFDTAYHEDAISNDLKDLGFIPRAINEAEAICYSELEADDYTGIALSFGAGMVNVCVMSAGEPILTFSTTKSGDWIDHMAALSNDTEDSVAQRIKEHGKFTVGKEVERDPILSAIAIYYKRLITYTVEVVTAQLNSSKSLPAFQKPIPIVIAGGTSLAKGFYDTFAGELRKQKLPFEIKEIRLAKDQLRAVSRGCFIASAI